ncbi:NAD(P)/FAD-dependent oxidoreductase [Mycobacterium sp. CBMA293]|nr:MULTISPECIES: NAD(P)/FAD-dependent oxidoreductase [unclassified Mycolicibacterium]MUM04014.1 hypothetical protein [Mycolicibacterium sp. CBMA 213]MUL50133.1 NAD(P)/FAD-dependent oxidoreductase [Mycolicibacterium sp. CBMA 360]MUL69009.1 NAD(P)/FAD-dependent oxidoreductase [Mycolicibacterium sp. CBMA 311]MUL96948.1 NAD(P)/FAD-dependent oxidoreductase [Mycolicibacterium sp. CBMA 230]MUM13447.1 NAD(P)/FAD-dependent oxidoreductase [Mycolicibacterium sp. CBMA 293]
MSDEDQQPGAAGSDESRGGSAANSNSTIETDYLVVGAGAMSLAFVDTILDETDASVVIVDRYDKPGGHWRLAYDYVRLHQPSEYYGVNSMTLGSGAIETTGTNAGLLELATADGLRDYFERVMHDHLLPSGRVTYLPNTEYGSDGVVRRVLSGETVVIRPRRRTVDGTFMKVTVPAMVPPPYAVGDGVKVIPPNGLSRLARGYDRYVVVGGGKTAIDTVLWLLDRGVEAARISWVMPADSWLLNREICQPGPAFVEMADAYAKAYFDSWVQATSMEELYDNLAESEYIFRLSDEVRPTRNRCATVTRAELAAIRRVEDVIRLGHVLSIDASTGMVLEHGTRSFGEATLYVDCTANGLARLDPVPVFSPGAITLQSVAFCNQVYGASFIAHIEAVGQEDATKNALTTPVPHSYTDADYVHSLLVEFSNELKWANDPEIVQWRQEARLAGLTTQVGTPLPPPGPGREIRLAADREALTQLVGRAELLIADLNSRAGSVAVGG